MQAITLPAGTGLRFEGASLNNNYMTLCDAGTFEHRVSILRHHGTACTPYWVVSEYRRDTSGKQWSAASQCVPDDFGNLLEVR